jgi:hypothetical protein
MGFYMRWGIKLGGAEGGWGFWESGISMLVINYSTIRGLDSYRYSDRHYACIILFIIPVLR